MDDGAFDGAAAISVVIPACNEEATIARCLDALLAEAAPGELDVVVVCNGCTDRTATVARAFPVRVLETSTGSKPLALNLGDRAASTFPRVYIDADTLLSTRGVRTLTGPLRRGEAEAVAPRLELDTAMAAWGVRAYHRIWVRLPQIVHGLMGRGVYALSRQGRARFSQFPDLIADDLFIHELFPAPRGIVVQGTTSRVIPAPTVGSLLRQKARVFAGNIQLHATRHRHAATGPARRLRVLAGLVRAEPALLPAAAVYLAVNIEAKRRGRSRPSGQATWQRDTAPPPSARAAAPTFR